MKKCPTCSRSYDDSQSFCLMDGTPLTDESEVETVVLQSPKQKKSKFLLWLALTGLTILVAGIAAVYFIYKFSGQDEKAQIKRQTNTAISPPSASSTPKAAPTPTAVTVNSPIEESSPKSEDSKPTPNNEESEETTPIGWETPANSFKNDDGQIYKFQCPPNGTENAVWGSDIYAEISSICTTAVHAGLFSLESGGIVTVEFRPGRLTYGSTVRNGIKSRVLGEYPKSFVVR